MYQLVDNIRGKVLQTFPTRALAEHALGHQSTLDNPCVEIKEVAAPKKKATKKVKADAEEDS